MRPLLILGLDGLDHLFVENHIDDLRNLSWLDASQNIDCLESTLPPITVPAWACSFTGELPERLNRFDFQALDFESYSFEPRMHTWGGREFWSFTDQKVALVDVPRSSTDRLNGWKIGGLMNVSMDSGYPEGLAGEVRQDLGDIEIEGLRNYDSEKKRREKAFEFFERRKKLLDWFLDNKDASVYFQVFRLPDTMMHHCSSDEDMLKAYKKCDEMLGELMEREDLNIIIVSDHGAVKAIRRFSVNTWLRENGYLDIEASGGGEGDSFGSKFKEKIRSLALKAGEFAARYGFRDYLVRANQLYGDVFGEGFVDTNLDLDSVDWENTEAFSYMTGVCGYSGIWINDGRFPSPAVEDRQAKKEELKEELEKHELVDEVLLKEEAFVEDAETFPDLVAVLGEKVKNDSDIKPNVTGKISSYMHRKQGFLGVYGDAFNLKEENAELIDLAPTVLHYLGEDIPEEMDGKVMDIFAEDSEPGCREPSYTSEEVADLDV